MAVGVLLALEHLCNLGAGSCGHARSCKVVLRTRHDGVRPPLSLHCLQRVSCLCRMTSCPSALMDRMVLQLSIPRGGALMDVELRCGWAAEEPVINDQIKSPAMCPPSCHLATAARVIAWKAHWNKPAPPACGCIAVCAHAVVVFTELLNVHGRPCITPHRTDPARQLQWPV
jgi:hypothetical protein